MKTKAKYIVAGLFAAICLGFAGSNITSLENLISAFEKYNDERVQEKVYLHTDKPYYAAGDDIWFKAYVFDAKTLGPTPKSNLLYVEFLDQKDKVRNRIKISLAAGTGWGNFTLPDTLKEGNYRIRAYTNWMRNFDTRYFFDHVYKVGDVRTNQTIVETQYTYAPAGNTEEVTAKINYKNIEGNAYGNKEVIYKVDLEGKEIAKGKGVTDSNGNIIVKFSRPKSEKVGTGLIATSIKISDRTTVNKWIPINQISGEVDMQFFPEGGDLISGVRSRVGFKIVKSDGLGLDVKGFVEEEGGNAIAVINPKYKGMGFFSLVPEVGKNYYAVLKFADGSEKKYNLPSIKPEGITLSANFNENADSIIVRVLSNQLFSEKNIGRNLSLVAQSSGNLIYSATSTLSKVGGFVVRFPVSQFPLGIAQFTLFNDQQQPLAERLAFIYKDDFLNLDVSESLKKTYKTREKVGLELKVKNKAGNPFIGSFSVAVTDETKVPVKEEEEVTIFSEILLNSDLRGNIETPNYYFVNYDRDKRDQLDVLMLTQGWRRFNWVDIGGATPVPLKYKPELTLALRGQVKNNKKVVPNASIIVFGTKLSTILQAKANEMGEFVIDSLLFPDSTKFVIQARSEKGKKFVEIEMDDDIATQEIPKIDRSELSVNISSSMMAYLKNSKTHYEELLKFGLADRTIMLDEVRVVDKATQALDNSSNLNGPGNADRIITASELENAPTMEFALMGKVAGLMFRDGEAYFMRNGGDTPVQIILDGMYVESEMLNSINPNDVESVEILKSISYTAIYGSRGGGGVIVINTKRGGGGGFSNSYSPGIISYMPLGLFRGKEFYSPVYDKPEHSNSTMMDYRSTIYWNPRVITEKDGTAKFNIVNSDGKGTYRIVIEGTDLNGHIGRKVVRYNVN